MDIDRVITTRSSKKNINSSMLINLLWQILPILVSIVSVPLTIEYYGKELFAIYALAISFIVGMNYLHFGVATNTNRDLSSISLNKIKTRSTIFWSGFVAMLFISIFLTGTFLSLVNIFTLKLDANLINLKETAEIFFKTTIIQTPIILVIIFLRSVLESETKFKITASNRAILNSLLLGSPMIAILLDLSFLTIPFLIFLFNCISIINLAYHCRGYLGLPSPNFTINHFIKIFKSGFSLTLISLGMLIFLYGDRYILSTQTTLVEATYFIVPLDILMRLSFIYGSIGAVFFPFFSNLIGQKKYSSFINLYKSGYLIVLILVGLSSSFVILFSSELLVLWLGNDFSRSSSNIMSIIALGIFFTGLTAIPGRALISLQQEMLVGYWYFFASISYIGLSLFLISYYGVIGAAYAFLLRSVVELTFLNLFVTYGTNLLSNSKKMSYKNSFSYSLLPLLFVLIFSLISFDIYLKTVIFCIISILALWMIYNISSLLKSIEFE